MVMTKERSSIAQRITHFFSEKLNSHLPNRTKRILLLGSLFGYICNKTSYDKDAIRKLNEVMALSASDSALMFPIQLSRVVWEKSGAQRTVPLEPQNITAKQLADRIPYCLQYSSYQEMFNDIKKLLENKPMLS